MLSEILSPKVGSTNDRSSSISTNNFINMTITGVDDKNRLIQSKPEPHNFKPRIKRNHNKFGLRHKIASLDSKVIYNEIPKNKKLHDSSKFFQTLFI